MMMKKGEVWGAEKGELTRDVRPAAWDHARDEDVEIAVGVLGDAAVDDGGRFVERCLECGVQAFGGRTVTFAVVLVLVVISYLAAGASARWNVFQGLFAWLGVEDVKLVD